MGLQLNKANTSDKETSFLDLNIKVIGSDVHTSVYDKRDVNSSMKIVGSGVGCPCAAHGNFAMQIRLPTTAIYRYSGQLSGQLSG